VKGPVVKKMSVPTEPGITVVISEIAGVALLSLDITMDGKSNKKQCHLHQFPDSDEATRIYVHAVASSFWDKTKHPQWVRAVVEIDCVQAERKAVHRAWSFYFQVDYTAKMKLDLVQNTRHV
jgi:hypothetical protein